MILEKYDIPHELLDVIKIMHTDVQLLFTLSKEKYLSTTLKQFFRENMLHQFFFFLL